MAVRVVRAVVETRPARSRRVRANSIQTCGSCRPCRRASRPDFVGSPSHGGWCRRAVADRLGAAGHRVLWPTSPGLGARRHLIGPDVERTTHILDLVNGIDCEGHRDAELVSHSHGPADPPDRAMGRGRHQVLPPATEYQAPYFDKYFAAADPAWIAIRHVMAHNAMMTEPDWLVAQLCQHVL